MAKLVSQSWNILPEAERQPWEEMARLDRERYDREKAAYKGPWKVPDVKDPNYPKKPVSAFLAFSNARRKDVAAANPTLSGAELSTLLSQLWKQCPEEVKQVYRQDEARKREVYKQKVAERNQQQKPPPGNDEVGLMKTNNTAAMSLGSQAQARAGPSTISTFSSHVQSTMGNSMSATMGALSGNTAAFSYSTNNASFGQMTEHSSVERTDHVLNCPAHEYHRSAEMQISGNDSEFMTWPVSLEPRRVAFGVGNEPVGFEGDPSVIHHHAPSSSTSGSFRLPGPVMELHLPPPPHQHYQQQQQRQDLETDAPSTVFFPPPPPPR